MKCKYSYVAGVLRRKHENFVCRGRGQVMYMNRKMVNKFEMEGGNRGRKLCLKKKEKKKRS